MHRDYANNFSKLNQLYIPNLSKNKLTYITDANATTVTHFEIRFYQDNNTSLQEQLHSDDKEKNIIVVTFNASCHNKRIEATNDFLDPMANGIVASDFADIIFNELNELLEQKRLDSNYKNNFLMFAGNTEIEVKLPPIDAMKGDTPRDKSATFVNFVSKLNSSIQNKLAVAILENYNAFKQKIGADIEFCGSKIGIIFTLDKDTVQGLETVFPFGSGVVETLNALA